MQNNNKNKQTVFVTQGQQKAFAKVNSKKQIIIIQHTAVNKAVSRIKYASIICN